MSWWPRPADDRNCTLQRSDQGNDDQRNGYMAQFALAKILHHRREFQFARERDTSDITDLPNPLPPRRAIK